MMKKGKQAVSQQQIPIQNTPQLMLQIQPKQIKLENQKKIVKQQQQQQQQIVNNQQITSGNGAQNVESALKIRKQNTQLVLPSIHRGNNFQGLQKRRQASASRENNHLPTYIGDKRGHEDDLFSDSENKPYPSQRKIQRPQSFIVKKKDKKADGIMSQNIPPQTKLMKIKSNLNCKQYSSNNSPTISEKGLINYDDILYNVKTSKNSEKIKFNPWKRVEEKKEENYEQLLLQLSDLKKKQKLQIEQYQQKQQQDFDNANLDQMLQNHQYILPQNKDKTSLTPQSLPESKEKYDSFQQIIKQNSLGVEKQQERQIENLSKVSNSSSQKGDQSSLGLIQMDQKQDIDRNVWKRKKINDRNQITEEFSSIERELYQINFLHNKNNKAINEYIHTQNSLLKLNIHMRKQNLTPQPQLIKENN